MSVLSQVVFVVLLAGGTFLLARTRLRGPMPRCLQILMAFFLATMVIAPLGSYDDPRVEAIYGPATLVIPMQIVVVGGGAVGLWARRRQPRPPREQFSWDAYGPAVLALVLFHWVLSLTAAEMSPLIDAGSVAARAHPWAVWLANAAFEGFLVLVVSQFSIGLLLMMLSKALAEDWDFGVEGGRRRRRQYLLAAGPVALCLVPSVVNGALLAGIVFRLLLLLLAWRCTSLPPAGSVTTLRALVARKPLPRGAEPA